MLAAIEICLSAIAIALACTVPTLGAAVFKNIETGFGHLARRRRLAILSVGLAALAARLAVLPVLPVPVPAIHDEVSHLLSADTMAQGGVTNPLRGCAALLMGLGLALLANTRPYESLFFCSPIAFARLAWLFRKDAPSVKLLLVRLVVPLSLVLALTITAMGYYFWRVTGSPFRIPYQVNMAAYHLVYFPWQQLAPDAEYHHAVMREFYQGRACDLPCVIAGASGGITASHFRACDRHTYLVQRGRA